MELVKTQLFLIIGTGIDDSIKRIEYVQRKYPKQKFINLDARYLEYPDNSFDVGLINDTSHHLNDKILLKYYQN